MHRAKPNQRYKLCALADLAEGAARGFDVDGKGEDTLFLVKRNGHCYAYRNSCPHWEGAPMSWRKDAYLNGDNSRIICHGHGAQFDIATGLCVSGPCLGQSLVSVVLDVDEDGFVNVIL
jgi:nitrite reductase/ring-hydroxylating ferredoxin subunit